ncbi:hypothetical protein LJB76_02865 [Clostridia bacterium OttesenSCG-928-O13]|nr:hypothetical protein [Clostridia bacterium OttesenSCG-928-O13]
MSLVKCRGCGAYIKFVKTPGDKWMPVNPKLTKYWPAAAEPGEDEIGATVMVTPEGQVERAGAEAIEGVQARMGFVPHWATCEKSELFKRAKRVREVRRDPPKKQEEEYVQISLSGS